MEEVMADTVTKPWYKKKTWWGTTIASVCTAGLLYLENPTPMGIIKAIIALGIGTGLFGASELMRLNTAANQERTALLKNGK
jgi:hypothetical protein